MEKLFMLLLGCKPPGRHTEQHDVFFGIGSSLVDLIPHIKKFWRGAGTIHIDAWREVNVVEGNRVQVRKRNAGDSPAPSLLKLFFINLGGYQENIFEEQHYRVLTAKINKTAAFAEAKNTLFYKTNYFEDAPSHIDDRYGIDVDDLYEVEDILSAEQKEQFEILITEDPQAPEDKINLGYFRLDRLS